MGRWRCHENGFDGKPLDQNVWRGMEVQIQGRETNDGARISEVSAPRARAVRDRQAPSALNGAVQLDSWETERARD